MPEAIPQILAPYLRQTFETEKSLSLITSTLANPAHWLLVRYLYAAIHGASKDGSPLIKEATHSRVIFISILRSQDLWQELCKKIGLDLSALAKAKRFIYIDGLVIDDAQKNGFASARLQSLMSGSLYDTVRTRLSSTGGSEMPVHNQDTTIIIDGIDFILASQPDSTTTWLQQCLSRIMALTDRSIITCSADSPLLHNRSDTATPLEKQHASFFTSLAHQATLVTQLRGLNTGAAKDVTGVMRITHGGDYEAKTTLADAVDEGEWLYQCKGDGSVRIWSRGD